ncbi:hypothetical protein cypCar_00000573, partial [Cyprinus carpio]
ESEKEVEHIEEMSILSQAQLRMNNGDTDEPCVHLCRQLRAKDDELRQVQNNMAQWKDKTTARLAHKFELELNAELESCVICSLFQVDLECLFLLNFHKLSDKQCRDYNEPQSAPPALQGDTDVQNSRVSQDLTSFKLLQHLQSRILQLRAESQTLCPSHLKWDRDPTNLGGSYLDTVNQPVSDY